MKTTRNFAIIAHIDHGKSTLADRLIQACGGLQDREMQAQVLDSMDIERERGITIKAQTVRLLYKAKDNITYTLNLIDTPGHVDFSYEVSRSLFACEGSLLVVDATQGVEAQTLANVYKAIDVNHDIIPVLNKIDLPSCEPERVLEQIEELVGLPAQDALFVSAKTGQGIEDILEAIVTRLPPPTGDIDAPLKAMVIDSWYDAYLGVVILVRIVDGCLKKGQTVLMMNTKKTCVIETTGVFCPKKVIEPHLKAGDIGFITAGIKAVSDVKVGDTLTDAKHPCAESLPDFKEVQPVVFCGLFPLDNAQFQVLREALEKLHLNDASFTFETETSAALGFGFRCGFLGLLHLEVVIQRLEREFSLDLMTTAPSVIYRITTTQGVEQEIHNPADLPDPALISFIKEPWIKASITVSQDYLGDVITLCEQRRGTQDLITYAANRVVVQYLLPLNEVVFDFYNQLKSLTHGYASFDYEPAGYKEGDVVKMSILVNEEPVDAFSTIVYRGWAEKRGRALLETLKELIPRHLFKIPLQAAIGSRVIARETIPAMRKDVTAKCYGGDITRKRKLLDKQKAGKKKMRQFGRVDIPQEVFMSTLKAYGDQK